MGNTSNLEMKKAILDLLDKLNGIDYINPESIPNIDYIWTKLPVLWMTSWKCQSVLKMINC